MSGLRREPNLFTIPAAADFPATLARALRDNELGFAPAGDPALWLADTRIFVPTRRAASALRTAFADMASPGPALLPRILPLGGLGESDAGPSGPAALADVADLPPAIGDLARRLALTRLTRRWSTALSQALLQGPDGETGEPQAVGVSFADAYALAGDLAALLDEMTLAGADWRRLDGLGEGHDDYWRLTTDFLAIVTRHWPDHLAASALMDAAQRQNALLAGEARRLLAAPPETPVIVAGSTGSVPATARLMTAIARLPAGAVILPGLDTELDEDGWAAIAADSDFGHAAGAGHPQAALKKLLATIGASRAGVRTLGKVPPAARSRALVASEAMRPAGTTERWREKREGAGSAVIAEGLQHLALAVAADEHEEAVVIAIALREALETPGRRAALVTPDRGLAARVTAELARWQVTLEDSAGRPLSRVPAGILARLALKVVQEDHAGACLLDLLSHEAVTLGREREAVRQAAAALELAALRGVRSPSGLPALRAALAAAPARLAEGHQPPPMRRVSTEAITAAASLVDDLCEAFAPLEALRGPEAALGPLADALSRVLAALTAGPGLADADSAGAGSAGDGWPMLAGLLDDLAAEDEAALTVPWFEIAAAFDGLMSEVTVPPERGQGARLQILGLLEARLLPLDLVVLGGLNEASWPPAVRTDAFLNRPMRQVLGLDPPERRIGQTAHDFVQALGHGAVVMTRALRSEGTPTVPSRFLQRLTAFCGPDWKAVEQRGGHFLGLARRLDRPDDDVPAPVGRPAPRPPVALRPESLSVTAVETLLRDPYAIHARRILDLAPLPDVSPALSAADRGNLIHAALNAFVRERPAHDPDPLARLLACGHAAFASVMHEPEVAAFWWPAFRRLAGWFVTWEAGQPPGRSLAEIDGSMNLMLRDGSAFRLRARADRIDVRDGGGLAIIDYKTGQPPGEKEVLSGLAPQLTLEAAIARAGGFRGIAAGQEVAALLYLRLGKGDGGEERPIAPEGQPLASLVAAHLDSLRETLSAYRDPARGYLSRLKPKLRREAGDYDHLARVAEWSDTAGAPDDEGAEGMS